jgi:hypothetical protein
MFVLLVFWVRAGETGSAGVIHRQAIVYRLQSFPFYLTLLRIQFPILCMVIVAVVRIALMGASG